VQALQTIQINPGNAILVIVDMENEFCKPGGKRYSDTGGRIMPGVISAIGELAERCRHAGIPVIYVQSVRSHEEPEFTVFGHEPILKAGTWATEIVEELKPQDGDTIIQKFSHDPFYKPGLDRVLQKLVADPTRYYAVVTGGGLNVCVYHTVLGFHLRDYWTVVLVDSVYYRLDSGKEWALKQFSMGAYPNVLLSRSDLIEVSHVPAAVQPTPMAGD
jgi:nicotinamidase-related amidase